MKKCLVLLFNDQHVLLVLINVYVMKFSYLVLWKTSLIAQFPFKEKYNVDTPAGKALESTIREWKNRKPCGKIKVQKKD